jgi:hypothetical protein
MPNHAIFLLAALPLLFSQAIRAQDTTLELEVGPVWQERNRVQIPNTAAADRFSLTDIAGAGPWAGGRLTLNRPIKGGPHGLRVVLAPLSYVEQGVLDNDLRYAGGNFKGGEPLQAEYKFNSWRVGYRYQFHDANGWLLWVGATAKIRDAMIELTQGASNAIDDDLGFVPLLHLAGEYHFNPRWSFRFDFDGLAGGPGRAFDIGLKLGYRLDEHWRIGVGYRGLEGGVDTDNVYNFAWFSGAQLNAEYRF